MIAVGFLNPALLWALPVAAIPILIHLLNRRRYRTVRWAAQVFLMAALQRNRRRLRLEQWLVLLLRTLAVVLLVLLVTRPQLANSVFATARTHHVVCLDDSASMAQRDGAGTVFKAALDRVQQLVDRLAATREGDLLTLLRTSLPTAPEIAAMRLGASAPVRVRERLGSLHVGDAIAQHAACLEQALRRAADTPEAGRAAFYMITDFRRADWIAAGDKPNADLLAVLASLDRERHELTVLPVGPADHENLGITAVRRGGRVAISGVPIDLTVSVQNFGSERSRPTDVTLTVDGQSRVALPLAALEPGEARQLSFAHTLHGVGCHGVVAALPADRYPVDDSAALVIEAIESSRVLLVDGDPGDSPETAETFFLALALAQREAGVTVQVMPDHALADASLDGVDLLFLCNIAAPDPAVVASLERFVRAGGGLVIFVGDQVDPARYNERLWAGGQGLLPAQLLDLAGDIDDPHAIVVADPTHGTMAVATEVVQRLLATSRVGRWLTVATPPTAAVRVVLRVAEPSGAPLLLTRNFGDGGEVMLVTTTADDRWTDLPRTPAFLVLVQQMHRIAAKVHEQSLSNASTTGVVHLPIDAAQFAADVLVRARQDCGFERTFTATATATDQEPVVTLPMAQLAGCGLFELVLTRLDGGSEVRLLARNPPLDESALGKLDAAQWRRTFPEALHDRVVIVDSEAGQSAMLTADVGEVWRGLGLAMLVVMLVESIAAWRFGGSRRHG